MTQAVPLNLNTRFNLLASRALLIALLYAGSAMAVESDSAYNSLLVDFLKNRAFAPPSTQCNNQEYPVFGVDIKIYNLGPDVNSKYSDYNPVLDKKESFMLFTSRRQADLSEPKDIDGQYYEKMFVSRRENGVFGPARPITEDDSIFGRLPTSERHESLIFLSYSEDLLITYTNEKLYYSNRIGKFYTEPVEFPKVINKGKWKRHASITEDGRKLYFTTESVSNESKNLNLEIWEIERNDDGSWKRPKRLPDIINTPYNEDSPEISPDGRFLFFSSNRAGGVGGYDVYMAENINGEWQAPKNLCQPINTPGDDIYFKLSRNGNYAYYSSNALGGYGNMDVYKVVLDVPSIATCGSYSFGRRNITFTSPFDIAFYGGGTEFFWSFGDEQTGVGEVVNHEYAADGDYNVVLYVRDRKSKRVINTVFSKKVRVDTERSTVDIMGPDTVVLGDEIMFDGSASFIENNPATAYYWKVDGNLVSREPVINYAFTGVGKHKIELEVGVLDERIMELSSSCIAREIEVVTPFVYKQTVGAKSNSDGFTFTPIIPDRVLFELGVKEENDPLKLMNDYLKTWEGESKTFSAFENDRSPGVSLDKIVLVTQAKYGTVKVTNASYGLIEYQPAPGFSGFDSFTYTAKSRDGRVAKASVVFSVMRKDQKMKGTNVTNDFVEVNKEPVTIYPLQNDEHNLGAKQKIVSVSEPTAGSVEKLGIDGLLRYSPSESFRGSDAFTYTVEDESGYKNTASVVIKATALIKSDIFANPDYATIGADEKARVKVLENDIVKGGADIVSIGKAKHGEAKLLNPKTGEIFYGPEQGFVGTDAFTYTLQNSKGEQSTTSVTVVVERKYDFSKPISIETYQYNQVNIFVFSELGVGSGFEFTSEPKPQYGKAKIVDAQNGIINYKPAADFTGYDLFFIDIRKGKEAHKVGIVVKVSEQSGLVAKYGLANHTVNATGEGLNQVSPIFEYQRLGKDAKIIGVSSTFADVSIAEGNLLAFDYSKLSKEQFAIAYQTEDANGKLNAGALLINPVDEIGMPLVTKMVLTPDLLKTKTNEPINVFPILNDRHLKGQSMKLSAVSKPLNGTVIFKQEDGSVMYVPNLDFNGTDAFTYTVQDENGLSATSAVNVVVMSEVQYKLENEGLNPKLKAFKYATLEPDKGFMNPEKVVDATNGLFGIVQVLNPNTGELQYTPNTGFAGTDRFNFSMLHKDGSYSNHPVMAVVEDRNEFFSGKLTRPDKLQVFNDEIVFYYPLINKQHPLAQKMRIVDVESENGGLTDIINETAFSYKPLKGDVLTDKLTFKIIDDAGKIQINEVLVQLKRETERIDLGTVTYETPVNEVLEISLKEKAQGFTYQDHTNAEKGAVTLKSALNLSFQYTATVANENDAFIVALRTPDDQVSYLNVNIKVLKEVDFSMERDRFDDFYLSLLPSGNVDFIGLAQPKKGFLQYNYEKDLFTYQPYSQVKGSDRLGIVVKSDSGISSVYTTVQHLELPSILDGQTAYQGITAASEGKMLIYAFSNIRNNNANEAAIQKIKSGKNGKLSVLSSSLGILEYTPNKDAKSDEVEIFIEDKEKQKQTISLAIRIQDIAADKAVADKELAMTAAKNMKSFNYELINYLEQENLTMLGLTATGGGEVNVFNLADGIFSYLPKDGNKGVEYLLVEVQDANGLTFVIPVQVNIVSEENYSGQNVTYKNVASVQGGAESYQAVLQQAGERLTAVYNAKGGEVRILDANQGIVAYKPFDGFIGEDSYTFEYLNLQGNVIQKQMQVFVRDASASLISMSEIKRQSETVEEKVTNVSEVLAFATEQSQANIEEDQTDYKALMELQAQEAANRKKSEEQARQAELMAMQQENERLAAEKAASDAAAEKKRQEFLALIEAQKAKEQAEEKMRAEALASQQETQRIETEKSQAEMDAEKKRQEFLALIEAQKAKELAEANMKAEAEAKKQADLMAQNEADLKAKAEQAAEAERMARLKKEKEAEARQLAEIENQKQAALAAQEQKAKADAEAKAAAARKAEADALAAAELAKRKKLEEDAVTGDVVVFRNILFDFDRSELRSLSKEELNKVYNYLFTHPDKSLQLDGHADWIGTVEYNLALSERRAKQAYDYLIARGIEESRLIYQYFGEAVPVAPNANPDGSDNPQGRQLNRRCEISIKSEGTAEIIMKF